MRRQTRPPRTARLRVAVTVFAVLLSISGCASATTTGDKPVPHTKNDVLFAQQLALSIESSENLWQLARTRTPDPELRRTAADHERQAKQELAEAARLLQGWGSDLLRSGIDHGDSSLEQVPGVPTASQLLALREVPAAQFDAAFISLMSSQIKEVLAFTASPQRVGLNRQAAGLAAKVRANRADDLALLEALPR